MSVIQSTQKEVRYLKRKQLEQESRIIGNALRDQIRQYGIDCTYYKLSSTGWTNFKNVIDQNTLLKRAYGYDMNPSYALSTSMITYADMQQDLFLMNRLGVVPNPEIDFYFDRVDFACALTPKCGQLREYKIQSTAMQQVLSGDGPFFVTAPYSCGVLSGMALVELSSYELDKLSTVTCCPCQSTSFNVKFDVNSDLYRSLKYTIEDDSYVDTLVLLTYRVVPVQATPSMSVDMLSGYVHGSLLFYDTDAIGKYAEMIHPMVGDIVEIDFPDDKNREKYEITDCYDKQLTQDGINPLLHKYIWKCKARRYINSYEDNAPESRADDRVVEMETYNTLVDEQVADAVSMYDTVGQREVSAYSEVSGWHTASVDVDEDAAYGGYDPRIDQYDTMAPKPTYTKYDFIDDGTAIDLIRFAAGSRVVTNGYDLLFMNSSGEFYQVTTNSIAVPPAVCVAQHGLRWLKATDSEIVFVNVEGESEAVAVDLEATQGQLELCLNSLLDKSLDDGCPLNANDQNFYKFKGTRSYLWSDGKHLYAKLASCKKLYQVDGHIDKSWLGTNMPDAYQQISAQISAVE